MDRSEEKKKGREEYPSNKDLEAVDKSPGEERDKAEKVTNEDLKGKKVDRDMDREEDKPISQIP